MTFSMLLVILGNLVFVLATGAIGIRLLRLGARTRQAPETLLGTGFALLVITIPMLAVSGLGRVVVESVRMGPLVAGLVCLSLAVACMSSFVWRTFHPGRRWPAVVPIVLGSVEIAILFSILGRLDAAAPDVPASTVVRDVVLWLRMPMTLSFGWMFFEGFKAFRSARRRDALGLGNPVVTNRFLLFAIGGGFAALNTVVSTILHAYGMTPFAHPAGAACFATGSTIGGATLFLAFLPPARYLAWVRARSAEASAS